MPTKVVHCKREPYDVYIGRGPDPKTGKPGPWGNPFKIGEVHDGVTLDRDSCLVTYEQWLMESNQGLILMDRLPELTGKVLGCWCHPQHCHGDILAKLADNIPVIDDFRGDFAFLSNFYGNTKSVEHSYQSGKAKTHEDAVYVLQSPTPGEAKRRGRAIKCRNDWESDKLDFMYNLLMNKFSAKYLKDKLLDTRNAILIEGNNWHDNEWGSCRCANCGDKGENLLGQLLMDIRRKLRG